ncbi:hypothetical protein A4D02_17135 [Niastella koreensis]|uniref:DUF4260 domain-containing protein n=2 Tax=Niastella koreensis TaxID=354356 RepID=G8TE75_NIAKG|nr:DUF4260 domain-containing protein [Niastella koreensis]AEV97266.1 hypothetical protein Niako_0887 [Niastella koreensis GR20-10]OQP39061.1 hypothetical protein A4D02_17135 [Niastella koreensis]
MKRTIALEEAAMFGLSIFLFGKLSFAWWWYLVLILTPDFSALGYLVNTRIGAISYNFFHHKAVAIIVYIAGFYLNNEVVQLIGLILFGHSSMDRMLGYGLKYPDSFQNTHLGMIGKKSK